MPKYRLKLINGGRDIIEHGMVEALVSGDIGKLDRLGTLLKKIDRKPKPILKLVNNYPLDKES